MIYGLSLSEWNEIVRACVNVTNAYARRAPGAELLTENERASLAALMATLERLDNAREAA